MPNNLNACSFLAVFFSTLVLLVLAAQPLTAVADPSAANQEIVAGQTVSAPGAAPAAQQKTSTMSPATAMPDEASSLSQLLHTYWLFLVAIAFVVTGAFVVLRRKD